jgi:hypothetical protein
MVSCGGQSDTNNHPQPQPQPQPPNDSCSTIYCPANSACVVSAGAAQCACNQGFILIGQQCLADRDEDGLADSWEAEFAASVAPRLMFSALEGFKSRFSYWAVGQTGSRLSVFYALAYVQDGGEPDLLGLTGHMGDSEFIVLDFVVDANGNATFDRAFLSAHFMASTDVSRWYRGELSFFQDSLGPHPIIWVARDKHGNYPDQATCDAGGLGFDTCDAGFAEFVEIAPERNLGHSWTPLIDRVDRAGGVDFFWTDLPFCGWQVSATGSRAGCAPPENSYAQELNAWEQGAL